MAVPTTMAIRYVRGLPISEITSAMQTYLGSTYVNDFDFNNRAYRVYVQADKGYRAEPKALGQYYARTNTGGMVPLASVVRVRETTAPQVISHFNLFRSAEINGAAAPGARGTPGEAASTSPLTTTSCASSPPTGSSPCWTGWALTTPSPLSTPW